MIIHFDNTELEIMPSDDSYRRRAIKEPSKLVLYYSLTRHIEIPVGAWVEYEGQKFWLTKASNFTKNSTRNFSYTLTLEDDWAAAGKYKLKNPVDGRLKFSYTAKPHEFIQLLVDNMNMREAGWKVGECVDAVEQVVSFNHVYCSEALDQIAEAFETEWEVSGKTINLKKVESFKDNPLPLSYGIGNGFKTGVSRSNQDGSRAVEILYVQGGTENINPSRYGSSELLLPKNQELEYEGRIYFSSADGLFITRKGKEPLSKVEDSLDCSGISPKRVGEVTSVVVVNEASHFYDFIDSTIPQELDFGQCLIEGETMTVIFQSGMLAGKEFDVKYIHEAKSGKSARRFEVVPQELDGQTMPNDIFKPAVGDKYAVFHIALPDAYVCDNATKTGASWDMFREAARYFYEHEGELFTFKGELDQIWAKKDWLNIGGRIKPGAYVLFSDEQFHPEGSLVRIVEVKDYVCNPHAPIIELSNAPVTSAFQSSMHKITESEVVIEDNHREALQFTKRRYRDSLETIEMLGDALRDQFSDSINPVAVQTMALLAGDESLQFRFVESRTNPVPVPDEVAYDPETKTLSIPSCSIQHMTLGIDTISSGHADSEYKLWYMPPFQSPALIDAEKKYYLYAKVAKTYTRGRFYLSETPIDLEAEADWYHLLCGVLNREHEGTRSYVSLYGFTEILPGQVMTDRIATSDGKSFIDFLNNALHLGNATSYLDWNNKVANTLSTINLLLENATIKSKLSVLGEALIAGFLFSDEIIKSTMKSGSDPAMYLNGKTGKIHLKSTTTGGDYSLDNSASEISIDAAAGEVRARSNNGVAYLSASGVFCNNAKTNAMPASSGFTHYGSIVGLGFGDVDNAWVYDREQTLIAGVYGSADNTGNAPAYGGYFRDLMAAGLILNPKYIGDLSTYYLDDRYTQCLGFTNSGKTAAIYLPTGHMEGKVIFAKQIGQGQMRFWPRSGQFIFDDISVNDYYDVPQGWEAKFTFAIFYLNDVKKEAWLVSRWKF